MATSKHDPRRIDLEDRDAQEVDGELRRILEPDPLTVERLVRTAMREAEQGGTAPRPWWPRLAAAAALVLLVVFLIPEASVEPPTSPGTGARQTPGVETSVASATLPRISISNADGYVTISSTLGSKWILVTGDDS